MLKFRIFRSVLVHSVSLWRYVGAGTHHPHFHLVPCSYVHSPTASQSSSVKSMPSVFYLPLASSSERHGNQFWALYCTTGRTYIPIVGSMCDPETCKAFWPLNVYALWVTLGTSTHGHSWMVWLVFGTFQGAGWCHITSKRGVVPVGFWVVRCEKWGACWTWKTYLDESGVL